MADLDTAEAPEERLPLFDALLDEWAGKDTVQYFRDAAFREMVRQAVRPPVFNVTVAGVPGHFTVTLGEETAAYSPGPPTAPSSAVT
jgi:hypothetical protein